MVDANSELELLFRRCLVRIERSGSTLGSGVWVAPGTVLTCAHVVAHDGRVWPGDGVSVVWQDRSLPGEVLDAAPALHPTDGGIWPAPDLALLRIPDAGGHPCAWLSERPRPAGTPLLVLGHSELYGTTFEATSALGHYGGPQGLAGEDVWRFKSDEIVPGMSGGPVLDLRTGEVCGLAKTTRLPDTDMGGLIVPLTGGRRLPATVWRDLWRAHDAAHADGPWPALRDRIRPAAEHRIVPTVSSVEEARLLGVLARFAVRDDLPELYLRAAGRSRAPAGEVLQDFRDVATGLSELVDHSDLHPLLRFAADLAHLSRDAAVDELVRWTEQVSSRRGEFEAYRRWLADTGPAVVVDEDQPTVTVQIEPGAQDPRRYLVTIWIRRGDGPGSKVYCDDSAIHPLPAVRRLLAEQLAVVLKRVHGWATVEFVVPADLFGEDFDGLTIGPRSTLGRMNPVVLRDLDRLGAEETWHAWRTRWQRLQTGGGVTQWLGCVEATGPDELDGRLRRAAEIATIGLPTSADGPMRELLETALYAGVPAAIWRRETCPDHPGPDEPCAGSRFRAGIARETGERPRAALPEMVHSLRNAVAAKESLDCRGVVLLWDDPDRLPEPHAPLTEPTPRPRSA